MLIYNLAIQHSKCDKHMQGFALFEPYWRADFKFSIKYAARDKMMRMYDDRSKTCKDDHQRPHDRKHEKEQTSS